MKKTFLWIRMIVSVMVLFIVLFSTTSAYGAQDIITDMVQIKPVEIDDVLVNPLMGWVIDARNIADDSIKQPVKMVYIGLTWRELQPDGEDDYRWDEIEEKYNIQYCRENNIKVVLRILLDKPRDYAHRDIPDWLYDKIGGEKAGYIYNLNRGVAPFYYKWPVEFSVADSTGRIISKYVSDVDIRKWLPGGNYAVKGSINIPKDVEKGKYTLNAAILDPSTGKPDIQLAIEGKREDGRYELCTFDVD